VSEKYQDPAPTVIAAGYGCRKICGRRIESEGSEEKKEPFKKVELEQLELGT
jgi:hypothetical protein